MRPAEPGQVIQHRFGQVTGAQVMQRVGGLVALGELLPVRRQQQRKVAILRRRPAQRLDELQLPGRVVQVIVAADDLAHSHVLVVNHAAQVVGGRSIGAQQHQVVELRVEIADLAMQPVLHHDRLDIGPPETQHRLHSGARFGSIPPTAVVARVLAAGALLLAHFRQFFWRAVAVVGRPQLKQPMRHFAMPFQPRRLQQRLAVRIQPETPQRFNQLSDVLIGRARPVRVLDPEQKFAAVAPRIQPVVQRRAQPPKVQHTGRAGSKACTNGHGR